MHCRRPGSRACALQWLQLGRRRLTYLFDSAYPRRLESCVSAAQLPRLAHPRWTKPFDIAHRHHPEPYACALRPPPLVRRRLTPSFRHRPSASSWTFCIRSSIVRSSVRTRSSVRLLRQLGGTRKSLNSYSWRELATESHEIKLNATKSLWIHSSCD